MQKAFVLQFVLGSHIVWLDYLPSSLPTRAVQRCGLSDPALFIFVRTFQAPIVNRITLVFFFVFFFSLLVRPLRGIPANRGLPARGVEAGNCLGPLSSPFPYGGEQCGPRKFCSVTQSTAESHLLLGPCKKRPYRLNRAGLQLQLPVCPTPAASSLAHHHRTLVNVWLKTGLSCRGSGSQH